MGYLMLLGLGSYKFSKPKSRMAAQSAAIRLLGLAIKTYRSRLASRQWTVGSVIDIGKDIVNIFNLFQPSRVNLASLNIIK